MRNFRQNIFNTEAIVVRINNFGESDRLINIITPKNGLIRGIAKGAKKPKSIGEKNLVSMGNNKKGINCETPTPLVNKNMFLKCF